MGYTHYFRRPKNLDKQKWVRFYGMALAIIDEVAKTVPLEDRSTPEIIDINGVDDDSHENFYVPRVFRPQSWQRPDENGRYFDFCKTARKPYDVAVTAILLIAQTIFWAEMEVRSDGFAHEWEDGLRLVEKVFPDFDVILPEAFLESVDADDGRDTTQAERQNKVITVELSEVIDNDLEGFLDIILERAGDPLGMDVDYTVVGIEDGSLRIEVNYEPSENN